MDNPLRGWATFQANSYRGLAPTATHRPPLRGDNMLVGLARRKGNINQPQGQREGWDKGAMFRKILIANRGEIAVRVMRACREMGICTVAVYSDVDRKSLHVRYADQAFHIGPAPSAESYLRIDRLLDAAKRSGAEAIHPGYGFLAENPEFARACADAGLVFIGPPVAAMELMGSKTTARQALIQAGLPVVPGADRNLESLEEAHRVADEIGYPVMLKASGGGGGKGLRLVRSPAELESACNTARSEAQNAFNDPSIYIEKFLDRPRHIEIQILGDQYGRLIHLCERECSLQRRHQKVLEECPSPIVHEELRQRMGEAAVRIGKLAGYWNAGTVEFLVDESGNFYFLEMNTRLQVEHPVTELVMGIDLVKEQVQIAAGGKLAWRQEDVRLRGARSSAASTRRTPPTISFLPLATSAGSRCPRVRGCDETTVSTKDGQYPWNMTPCSRKSRFGGVSARKPSPA